MNKILEFCLIFYVFSGVGKIPWRRKWQPTSVFSPGKSHRWQSLVGYCPWVTKSRTRLSDFTFTFTVTCCLSGGSPPNARDTRETGSIPGLGGSPGVGNGNPLQYSFLENSMDRGAWQTAVHRITKSWTQLSHTHTHTHTHTCILTCYTQESRLLVTKIQIEWA